MSMGIQIYINGPAACGKTHLAKMLRDTIAEFQDQLPSARIKVEIIEQRTMNTDGPYRP